MTKKHIYLFGSTSLLVVLAAFLYAQQVWPVQSQEVAGVYQSTQDVKDRIYLKPDGIYVHDTGRKKYIGKWSVNEWDADVSLVSIKFKGEVESNTPYIIGSRFGRVVNLYITNKSPEEWRKVQE